MSVVFVFNASLNDVAPVLPNLLTVYQKWLFWWISFCVFLFCLYILAQVQWVFCLISVPHSMRLLLFLQSRCLLIYRERKKWELLMDVFFVSSFFCPHSPNWVLWVLCLILMLRSMTLLLCLQSCCLLICFFRHVIKTTSRIKNSDRLESLTSEIEFSAGNDVHRKCNTLNRAFFLGTTPYNNNTNVSFSFEFIEKKHYKLHK